MLYTKHFYGFEKEGKTEHFLDKQVNANVINFRYPLKLSELQDKLHPQVCKGLTDVEFLKPKSEEQEKEEAKQAAELAEKIAKMTD